MIALVVGLPLFLFGMRKPLYRYIGAAVACFGILVMVLATITFVPEYVSLRGAYARGESSIVQGVVEDFRPAPALGPARESFSVHGIEFHYNTLDATPCFHNAPFGKGPIRPGLEVRILYKDRCIQRVDVRR